MKSEAWYLLSAQEVVFVFVTVVATVLDSESWVQVAVFPMAGTAV